MDIERLVHCFISDARRFYADCATGLGLADSSADLAALLRAARARRIGRRGECTGPSGGTYEYHVHGSGYTFRETGSGKEIRFDVTSTDNARRLRFSPWEVAKYVASTGEPIAEDAVAAELTRLSASAGSRIERLPSGVYEYEIVVEESSPRDAHLSPTVPPDETRAFGDPTRFQH